MEDISGDLERFDNDFKPGDGRKPGLATLPDGSYEFRIVKAETARVGKTTKDPAIRMTLQVLTKGQHYGVVVESLQFLKSISNVEIFGSMLVTLGIDADQWQATGRKFSAELPGALEKIAGLCFAGAKTSKPKDAKMPGGEKHHNVYVNERIAAPADFPPLDSNTGGDHRRPADEEEDDIPF